MAQKFDIRKSHKDSLTSPEKFSVTRNAMVFLRVLGEEPLFEIMTATTGDERPDLARVSNQAALLEAALRTANEFNTSAKVESDHRKREYVKICRGEYLSDAYRVAEVFFAIFDSIISAASRPGDELVEIYECLAIDDSGDDIYLGDGVWLGKNGSTRDTGR